MRRIFIAFIAILTMATPSHAQDDYPFLRPDAIRAAYEAAQTDWETVPNIVGMAFVAGEDREFFKLPPSRSTLTREISRWYPNSENGQSRIVGFAIGQALTHDEIVNWYVNGVFLGRGCFGVKGAASAYFKKLPEDLGLAEAAYLAALPAAPATLHPLRDRESAITRRNFVLSEMEKAGFISEDDARTASETDLEVVSPLGECPVVN